MEVSYRGAVTRAIAVNSDGTVKSSQKIAHQTGGGPDTGGPEQQTSAFWPMTVSTLGDLDGDGVPDLAVGALAWTLPAATIAAPHLHVLLMNTDGTVKS